MQSRFQMFNYLVLKKDAQIKTDVCVFVSLCVRVCVCTQFAVEQKITYKQKAFDSLQIHFNYSKGFSLYFRFLLFARLSVMFSVDTKKSLEIQKEIKELSC